MGGIGLCSPSTVEARSRAGGFGLGESMRLCLLAMECWEKPKVSSTFDIHKLFFCKATSRIIPNICLPRDFICGYSSIHSRFLVHGSLPCFSQYSYSTTYTNIELVLCYFVGIYFPWKLLLIVF